MCPNRLQFRPENAAIPARYEGFWEKGAFHGLGRYHWAGGAQYEGEWDKGKRHGYGRHLHANGTVVRPYTQALPRIPCFRPCPQALPAAIGAKR